jgi:transposase
LQTIVKSSDASATVATRARIVLWHAEECPKILITELAGVSRPTVGLWLHRYQAEGIAGLYDRSHAAPREQVPARIRSRILAATRMSPPADTGLSQWSSREMAAFMKRTENVYVSHHYVAKLWRENGLKPHRMGTFKVSKDPVGFQKLVTCGEQWIHATSSYSLIKPCRTGRRLMRSWLRSATGWVGRGG